MVQDAEESQSKKLTWVVELYPGRELVGECLVAMPWLMGLGLIQPKGTR